MLLLGKGDDHIFNHNYIQYAHDVRNSLIAIQATLFSVLNYLDDSNDVYFSTQSLFQPLFQYM